MVDIGVGEVQCAVATCIDCGAAQIPHHIEGARESASPEEQKRGWYRGRLLPVDPSC